MVVYFDEISGIDADVLAMPCVEFGASCNDSKKIEAERVPQAALVGVCVRAKTAAVAAMRSA